MLSDISSEHLVFDIDHAWFVVGPTGVFVVCGDDGGAEFASQRAVDRARIMRSKLANELSWIPFVDSLVVTDDASMIEEAGRVETQCPVIPLDMLAVTVNDGPRSIDEDTLGKLALLGLRRST